MSNIRKIARKHRISLLGIKNVNCVYVGYKKVNGNKTNELAIVCGVSLKRPLNQLTQDELIPKSVDNIPTDVIETGEIKALEDPTKKFRPAPGGVSVGHYAITTGTLGCWVKRGEELFILSNNHVIANSNDALPGDAIYQPGSYDGGGAGDRIAVLREFVPINFGTGGIKPPTDCKIATKIVSALNWSSKRLGRNTRVQIVPQEAAKSINLIDAAIGKPLDDLYARTDVLEIGFLAGSRPALLGENVVKYGRTTHLTTGFVEGLDGAVSVSYGPGKVAVFEDQIMLSDMSAGGDSGSVIIGSDNKVIGLLFAGSDTITIASHIEHVLAAFDIEIA